MPNLLDDHLIPSTPAPAGGYEFYRDFIKESQVVDFVAFLEQYEIPHRVEKSRLLLDKSIAGQGLVPFAVVKLRPSDFSRVGQLLAKSVEENPSSLDGHYFQQFTAAELLEVLRKPDEWTPEDVAAAQILLKKQGVAVPASQMAAYRQQRTEELRTGKEAKVSTLWLNVLAVVVGGLFIGPLFFLWGVGMGWYYWKDRTTDGEGNQFFTFEPQARKVGQIIFFLGWACLVVGLLLRLVAGIEGPRFFDNFHF